MSGLVRGKIECVINAQGHNRDTVAQQAFKNLYDFFVSHPNYTMIALQYGSSSTQVNGSTTSGTGVGFYDQAVSFGYNAFFVVRANATVARPYDVYYLFQWAGATNQSGLAIGTAPGAPALGNGFSGYNNNTTYAGVSYQVAIGIGGSGGSALSPSNGNPWKGSSSNNGTDTKPTTGPIFGAPAGGGTGVIIFPRSNDNVGGHRLLTQNQGVIMWWNTEPIQVRMHVIADDDNFVIATDIGDNESYSLSYSGLYTPRTSLSPTYPFCTLMAVNALPFNYTNTTVYGDTAGTSNLQGGIVQVLSGTVAQLQLDHLTNFAQGADYWPNRQFNTTMFDELTIPIGIYEVGQANVSGYLGQIDFIREMYNVPTNAVKSDYSRIFLGSTTLAATKYSVPWDKETKTVPRSGNTRQGYSFVAPSLPGPLS